MDDLDRALIARLRHDAREPVSSLSQALGVARATVRARIDRLVERGVIQGFTIAMGQAEGARIRAVMMVEVEGRATETVFDRLNGFPEIRALYSTNGRWDIVAELEAPTLEAFDATLRQIRQIEGISLTETSILLATRKAR